MSISLPLASESVRCVDFALANQIDPGGTALAPDVVVLVEVPEPWPKPVAKHEHMADLVGAAQMHPEQVRLLAAVPLDPEDLQVIAFRPTPTGMERVEQALGDDPVGALQSVLTGEGSLPSDSANGVDVLLVCTQGSHDICCGVDGAEFAHWAEEHLDVEVFRVSHTGGHRFAPTAMTLPDGRMWAYLGPESAYQIISDREDASGVAALCRGWWGAPTGPAQVAERAVFAELGFAADNMARIVTVSEADGGHNVVVTADEQTFDMHIAVGREVPTIACGAPGGQPVKPGREWTVVSGPTRR
jgi:hypothetical protein